MKVQKQHTSNDDDDERQRSTRSGNFSMRICFWKVMELGVDFLSLWDVKIFIKYFLFFSISSKGKKSSSFSCFCAFVVRFLLHVLFHARHHHRMKRICSLLCFSVSRPFPTFSSVSVVIKRSLRCFLWFFMFLLPLFPFLFYFHRAAFVVSLLPYFMIH